MTLNLTIKQKLIAFAFIVTALLLGIGFTGYSGVREVDNALQTAVRDSQALRNNMSANRMHDALRADVYAALNLGPNGSEADKRALRDALAEHIDTLKDRLSRNDLLPLEGDIKAAISEVRAPLEAYMSNAQQMVALSLRDSGAARLHLNEFSTPFHVLESKLSQLSDLMEKQNQASVAKANATVGTTQWIIILAGSMAVLITGLLAWRIPAYIITSLRRVGASAAAAARGDLTARSTHSGNDEIGELGRALNTMLNDFNNAIGQITGSSTQLAAAAEEMSAITEQTNQGVKQQQNEVDQVATAMNEMTATVQEVARNAEQAAHAAQDADRSAKSGALVASEAMGGIDALVNEVEKSAKVIRDLEAESENIGTVLDVIKGIAEQTNLLALNAAIEAARAGEQGRGFAVVADEVRTLASRTQKSTQEIHAMIERLQSGASNAVHVMEQARLQGKKGVEQVERTAESLASIAAAVATINDMNTQIASAAEEQSSVAEEINRNVVNISQGSAQSAQGSEQTALASMELARLASDMQTLVARFKI